MQIIVLNWQEITKFFHSIWEISDSFVSFLLKIIYGMKIASWLELFNMNLN